MNRKYIKNILLLMCILSFLLLCGCESLSIHMITRTRFDHFLDQCLKEYASSDVFSLHYKLKEPSDYGIKTDELPSFPDISESAMEEDLKTAKKLQKTLSSYHKDALSKDQQLVYDLLSDNLDLTIELEEDYPYYTSAFGNTGSLSSLPDSLAEYDLGDADDVEQYFDLLEDLPDYLDELMAYEKRRQQSGISPSATEVSDTIASIDTFLSGNVKENTLSSSFADRINAVSSISEEAQSVYINKNTEILKGIVLPAYEKIRDEITEEYQSADGPESICQYPNGKDYYNLLLKYQVGTDMTGEDCEKRLLDIYDKVSSEIQTLLDSNSDLPTAYADATPELTDSTGILSDLKKNTLIYFPAIDDISCDVKNSENAVFSQNTVAYYITPAYGSSSSQTIYLNPLTSKDTDLYSTLAHEGYPGHLYQVNYFYENLYHPIQLYLTCNGFDEGWGTYAQLYSYDFMSLSDLDADSSENVKTLMKDYSIESECLCSLCDLYVNYDGKDEDSVLSWLEATGASKDSSQSIYNYVTKHPTAYLSYSIGYDELTSLKQNYDTAEEFHKTVLSYGSCPFYILKTYMKDSE